jgi:hypothetical protein
MNDTRDGMITQIFSNSMVYDLSYNSIYNYSVGTQIIDFDEYNILTLSRDFDCYIPQNLVINLLPNLNLVLTDNEYINSVCTLFNKIRLVIRVSGQPVLQFPLSLLHELNPATIYDRKIYIRIPFTEMFDNINMSAMRFSNVSLEIHDFHEINNYANSVSLLTKIYIYNLSNINISSGNNFLDSNKSIQQIGTLQISVDNNIPANRRYFNIQTNTFNGLTKGFLIQGNINELVSIKFYINNLLRFNYDRFLVLNACVKISDNLIYMPFNDYTNFSDRSTHTFAGGINFSLIENSIMCLNFSTDQSKFSIHNVYSGVFRCFNGVGGLSVIYRPEFIQRAVSLPLLEPINGIPPNPEMFDLSGNFIQHNNYNLNHLEASMNNRNMNYLVNYIYNIRNENEGTVGSTGTEGTTGTVGSTGTEGTTGTVRYDRNEGITGSEGSRVIGRNRTNIEPRHEYPIPNGSIIYKLINPERNICNITHEEIIYGENYMNCTSCNNNFIENIIKQWFRNRIGNLRTCPTCREIWTNYSVYVNINSSDEIN